MHRPADLPEIAVICPTRSGARWLGPTLTSVLQQTLAAHRFEVVVVQHGPDDGTAAVVARARAEHPDVALQLLRLPGASRGAAKNAGVAACRAARVTFVDDEDRVSARFLAGLLAVRRDGLVVRALEAPRTAPWRQPDVVAATADRHAGAVRAEQAPQTWTAVAGRVFPTAWVQQTPFDDLDLGEDSVFWARRLQTGRPKVVDAPVTSGAVYVRTAYRNAYAPRLRPSALLEGLTRLIALPLDHELEPVRSAMIAAENRNLARYLQSDRDAWPFVREQHATAELAEVDLELLVRGLARDLVVCGPGAGSSWASSSQAVDAPVDLVRADELPPRDAPPGWSSQLDQQARVPAEGFCTGSRTVIRRWERSKGRYTSVRSAGPDPGAHAVACWYKVHHPGTRWIAELPVSGLGAGELDPEWRALLGAVVRSRREAVPAEITAADLVTAATHAAADEVVRG